jgi:hypothetical protein
MSLEDVASWSRDRPVLLVLDWRSTVEGAEEFERFLRQEVPLYQSALKVRGAIAAWCCRADVRRRGWRDSVSGIGFPSRGQRTYYMIERGNVVAWRTVKDIEFPQRTADTIGTKTNAPPVLGSDTRFIAVLTSLIVSNEAASGPLREWLDQYFKNALGHRRNGHQA